MAQSWYSRRMGKQKETAAACWLQSHNRCMAVRDRDELLHLRTSRKARLPSQSFVPRCRSPCRRFPLRREYWSPPLRRKLLSALVNKNSRRDKPTLGIVLFLSTCSNFHRQRRSHSNPQHLADSARGHLEFDFPFWLMSSATPATTGRGKARGFCSDGIRQDGLFHARRLPT